ncbi:origin recognition complex subunit 3 [Anthonomus grandis grandis]|uniref:origin recognition complex subunit 3 n=1 Tax=Anthonomus grandis grandis TaxID=2921223 RepID=UPI0021669A76|nr:origin recognition complex subunit 3 [Anthonomus grandis grandis]
MGEKETISVSKASFVFKNNFKKPKKGSKKSKGMLPSPLFENLWYQQFKELWSGLSEDLEELLSNMFTTMTTDLVQYIKDCHKNPVNEIPTAALLTGINMPDHEAQFKNLEKQLKRDVTPHVAFLTSQDCANIKFLIEKLIYQYVNNGHLDDTDEEDERVHVKRSYLSFPLLQEWYEDLYPSEQKNVLVVIIPDFESFNVKVLQTFISIVSLYLEKLKFVFVFGIATSVSTLHTSFPYHVTSKTNIKVFRCEPSTVYLNQMLENVFFRNYCAFHLGGKVFDLFTEIFLYYDFSMRNFVQNIKYAMMEHFCFGNAMALCDMDRKTVKNTLQEFSHEDFDNVRYLKSFRTMVESESDPAIRIKLITDNEHFKTVVLEKVTNLQRYIRRLHIFLECLYSLVCDLPESPLGKNLREVYALAVTKNITESIEFKEAFKLLHFQSKEELTIKLGKVVNVLKLNINETSKKTALKDCFNELNTYINLLNNLNTLSPEEEEPEVMDCEVQNLGPVMDRKALKQALLFRSKDRPKPLNRYEKLRNEILDFLLGNFKTYLVHYSTMPLHEIFFFNDFSIKSKIIGMHRTAIHNALNDPQFYLQCKCCEIPNSQSIKPTMPDICIAYKLHLECGKMINLYDWLQAFLCIVDPKDDDDFDDKSKKIVEPQLQARFTQAVAELEYLGFIKSSKRKADHVTRLTWGG